MKHLTFFTLSSCALVVAGLLFVVSVDAFPEKFILRETSPSQGFVSQTTAGSHGYENASAPSGSFLFPYVYTSDNAGGVPTFAKWPTSSSIYTTIRFNNAPGNNQNWLALLGVSFEYSHNGGSSWSAVTASCNPVYGDPTCSAGIPTPSSPGEVLIKAIATFTNMSTVTYPPSGHHAVLIYTATPDASIVWRNSAPILTVTGTLNATDTVFFDNVVTRLISAGCTGYSSPWQLPWGHMQNEFKDASGNLLGTFGCWKNTNQYIRCTMVLPPNTAEIVQNYKGCEASNPLTTDPVINGYSLSVSY